jgi:hypothetical protein
MNTLKDLLSHLTFRKACKLLGAEGEKLIRAGGQYDIDAEATLDDDAFRFLMGRTLVTITLDHAAEQSLRIRCGKCAEPCVHQGAALSMILEDKVALGLAAPPPQRVPVENLSGEELIQQAISEPRERALNEKMQFTSADPDCLWSEYSVSSLKSAAVLPPGGQQHVPGRQKPAGLLNQAGRTGRPARSTHRGRGPKDHPFFRVDEDARPDPTAGR